MIFLFALPVSIEFSYVLKQVEKGKQDDALSDISDILGELKEMAIDMGSEIERLVQLHFLFIVSPILLFSDS